MSDRQILILLTTSNEIAAIITMSVAWEVESAWFQEY